MAMRDRTMRLAFILGAVISSTMPAALHAATLHANPGDDLQSLVNKMQNGDELLLADGTYAKACIDFSGKSGITIRAERVVPVKIELVDGEPIARGGSVTLRGAGKPFVLARGANITI